MIRVDETDPVGEVEPSFPYRDVTIRRGVQFTDFYDIQSEIGRGKFGTVYRCQEKKSGLTLAAKVVNTTRKEDRRAVEREVEIMRRLQHPRLIQLYDSIEYDKQIYVILELIEGGELFERVIDDDFVLTERSCAVFMRQICEGIEFVHSQNILHLDMKPENILCLTKEGNRIKIIDFGLAREYDPKKKLQVLFGTPEFVAPEVVNFDQIGFGTDMWSIGVICYVLLSGLSPFMGDTDVETMANVTIAKYDFDDEAFAEISEDAKDFIRCLLVKDITVRYSARQCMEHRWLNRRSPPVQNPLITMTSPEPASPEQQQPTTKPVTRTIRPPAELDVTKDNLRIFVERWREHPDSPYTIDTELHQRSWDNEAYSLRCQSPSPCGSICSASSESTTATTPSHQILLPELSLERRASEGQGIDPHRRMDPAAQILLAEEIVRLSEHLRAIASKPVVSQEKRVSIAPPKNEISEKLSTITRQRLINGTTFSGARTNNNINNNNVDTKKVQENNNSLKSLTPKISKAVNKTSNTSHNSSSSSKQINGKVANASTSSSKMSNGSNLKVPSTSTKVRTTSPPSKNSTNSSKVTNTSSKSSNTSTTKIISTNNTLNKSSTPQSKTTSNNTSTKSHSTTQQTSNISTKTTYNSKSKEIDLIPPWRMQARAKKRFSEAGRDVPRISTLQDIHKSMNLNEPTCTKNLLLKLIDEWGEITRPHQGMSLGRKSMSIDWCSADESLVRNSINSLAEYFQSEHHKAASSQTTISPAPATIPTAE